MNEQQPFEAIRKSDEAGREYWSARNPGPLLDYKEWRNFYKVIAKAIISCEASGHPSADHFVETNKMVELGSGASRNLEDFHLSRYACYLVVQNGDPSKPVIAAGQTYLPCKPGARNCKMIKYLSLYERMKSDCSCAMSSKSIINIWLKRPNVLVLRRLLILLSFKTMVIKVSMVVLTKKQSMSVRA
ncbi:DNA-damage-inducible protein D [Klebsiella pneumoniae]|nr:DNA-damage-inducible protein D [Klebsiella pneumoniae]